MIHTVLEGVLGFIFECLISIVWWFILFPIIWLVSLPFILVIALFRRGSYSFAVTSMLTSVHGFWREWGLFLMP